MKHSQLPFILFISLVAAIGGFLFGYDSAVINGTVSALQQVFNSTSIASGFSVASMLIGCALGALIAGPSADRIGRRKIMMISAILFFISAMGSGIAKNINLFIFYRLLGGLAVGAASVIAPTYISEIAPQKIRGRLASLQQLAIVIGIFSSFIITYLIAKSAGGSLETWIGEYSAWQWMFWSEAIPAFIYFILIFFIPESPRYLCSVGKEEKARDVLSRVLPLEEVDDALKAIKETSKREHKPKISDIIEKGRILPIVWVGIGLSVFQQFVGINVVFYYGSVLWQAAGFDESAALLINVLSGVINILATLCTIALIDKLGRKPLLIFGSIGMAITLGTLTFIFSQANFINGAMSLSYQQAVAALISAHLYIFCFGVSWGPTVWVLLGEMFNNHIRGAAISIAASAQWIANFVITMTFPVILNATGLIGAYGLYTIFAVLSLFFVIKYVKETKGISLEKM